MIILYCVGWLFIGFVTGLRIANSKKPKPIGNLVIMNDSTDDGEFFALEISKSSLENTTEGDTVVLTVKRFRQ